MTNARNLMVAAAAAIVAAVAVGVVVGSVVGDPTSSSPRAGTTDAPAGSPRSSAESRPGTTEPSTAATTDAAGVESAPASPSPSSPGRSESKPSPTTGLPGVSHQSHQPTQLPSWDGLSAETATARGRLVDGYPSGLLPTAPRATVLTSSVSPSGDRVQVTLVARRGQAPDALLRFYRGRLSGAGFAEDDPATVGGARAASFHLGANRVVVTVDPGDARTYSVLATFDVSGA
ncbi:hypothetical protein ASC77_08960 [Nocardioides sp. Root1257]|uniref:hypothetical protein n=1 Tax=unclassified Nocardioides TaxID=2615069 RepID=UPI0006F8CBC1|nr:MULTISPECIES: hypothetical protein [unclassified Nocardioides]KQW48846.1 hypothetical protein ASC77_08960 [Nocardioides sp. Root1257]KRC48021.1 hypothetical protein ASE24_08965 [Nocardioides sp. Root224]